MIARIFWSLFTLEAVAIAILLFSTLAKGSRGWGPEGPVGGWLIGIPPLLLLLLAVIVLVKKSDAVKLAGIAIMGFPLLQIALGPLWGVLERHRTDRSLAGDETFTRPAQRKLAHAIHAHDLALVKTLIPGAGDLNREYRGETILRFAIVNADSSTASRQIVKALLDAGANPNVAPKSTSGPLIIAIPDPELTGMLLEAGADPNRRDDANRPSWWNALSNDSDAGLATLRLLLDHGADLTSRDGEGGPVAWAAYHAWMSHGSSWRLVQLLIERGAKWKDEQEFGRSVIDMFNDSLREREGSGKDVPESMTRIKATFSGDPTRH
jgi:hypothetical protein